MATRINSATAIAPRVIRVVFDSACADATALSQGAWSFAVSGVGPFYTPVAVSVAGVDSSTVPSSVDVTTDQEATPGILYSITATGITGIPADTIRNVSLFYPIVPAVPSDRDVAFIDIVPEINKAEDSSGDLTNFVACLQEVSNLLWNDIDRWGNIFDIDSAAEKFLDLILKQLGNPVALDVLTVAQKRTLCAVLVKIYKIKGTIPGIVAAIKFFVGLPAQVSNFYGGGAPIGEKLPTPHVTGTILGVTGGAPGTWILGGGDPWTFTVKCGTPGGAPLTADQAAAVTEIVNKTKFSISRMIVAPRASFSAPARLDIKDNGSHSLTLTCAAVSGATTFKAFWRPSPGVTEWNTSTPQALTGAGPSSVTLTADPSTDPRYWVGCVAATIPGLISNEVTNVLTAPVLTATPHIRKISLAWPAVTNATSYRIYRSVAAATRPSVADNRATPIRVNGTTFDDPMESGTTFYYIVVPLVGDSEGFFSNESSATAL